MRRIHFAPRMAAVLVALPVILLGGVQADGIGLIGWGKDMYRPACAAACRNIVKSCRLLCTPTYSSVNHGTSHSPVVTPPDCFTSDPAFLRTVAVCIDNYCPGSDAPASAVVADFWASHLGTGTVGDYTWVPVLSYDKALAAGRADEHRAAAAGGNATAQTGGESGHGHMRRHGASAEAAPPPGTPDVRSALPAIAAGQPLNMTSFIVPRDWQLQYNGYLDFEQNEVGHSTYTITVVLVALFLPVALSMLRFLPGFATGALWMRLRAALVYPALGGRRHREPVAAGAVVPTRGQALYIFVLSFLNVVFLLAPYTIRQPQTTFASRARQETSIIGNRAGSMAMGNAVALTVFAARHSPLFWLADWSYGTYMLLHRWLGYWTIAHTVLHSVLLLAYYVTWGDYEAELAREYWVWGIVGTVAVVAIVPTSLPVVRRKVYEFFVASHVLLSLLFIIGYYYHIWYCYEYRWGYEIWAYIMGTIWGAERLARLARLVRPALAGARTATVTIVPGTDDEYVRIEVEGIHVADGVVYLGFPSLSWRVWESHPFSVAFAGRHDEESLQVAGETAEPLRGDEEKEGTEGGEKSAAAMVISPAAAATSPDTTSSSGAVTTFFARTRTGMTKQLAARAATGGRPGARIGVLVEGPYRRHAGLAGEMARCTRVVCVAGGVGVTACLPYLAQHGERARLYWSARHAGLTKALEPVLAASPAVVVEVRVGARLDVDALVAGEFAAARTQGPEERGPVGFVVCGPAGMADDVRGALLRWSRTAVAETPFVLDDEAFAW